MGFTNNTPTGSEQFSKDKLNVLPLAIPSETMQRLAAGLEAPFLLAKEGPGGRSPLEDIWEGAKSDLEKMKRLKDLEQRLVHLESLQGGTALGLLTAPNPELIKKNLDAIVEMRREILGSILREMGIQRHPQETSSAYIQIESKKKDIEEEIAEYEALVFQEPPDPAEKGAEKNPLFYKNNRATPYFPRIDEINERLKQILAYGIDMRSPNAHLARARILRLQQGLSSIAAMNPQGTQEYLAKKARGPGILSVPLQLAGTVIPGILSVLSLIPVLRKLAHGEKLAASDWPAAAWPALTLYMGGFLPDKAKSQVGEIATVAMKMYTNDAFRNVVGKMGGVNVTIPAVREVHDILQTPADRKTLEGMIARKETSIDFLKAFTGKNEIKDSPLLLALTGKDITNEDRRNFLAALYDINIQKQGELDSAIATLYNLEAMKGPLMPPPSS